MKQDIAISIREKELQLSKLSAHIDKSEICSELYNKILIEKAILVQELKELQENSIVSKIKHLIPKKNKAICDYFE